MSIKRCPVPFFDTLEMMKNPYKHPVNSVDHLIEDAPAHAIDDYQHASEFLYSYRGSQDTFSTYRREIEHFLHWAWLVAGKSLGDVRREDVEAYVEFSRSPPPAWIGKKTVARYVDRQGVRVPNEDWRPYVLSGAGDDGQDQKGIYTLSQSAIQSLFSVLSSFYNYLIQEEYVSLNPVSQIRQKSKFLRKSQGVRQVRRLSQRQWETVMAVAHDMADTAPALHHRTLFIMQALFGMYLRISELVETPRWTPTMGDFMRDTEGQWWFHTVGKGNKARQISVSDDMMQALVVYRRSRGLCDYPAPGESQPLIHKTRGRGGITSTRQIRGIVQACFDQAIERLRAQGEDLDAQQLSAATVHWLRHTGISEDVKHRPREHVRDDAGHGSSAITDRYIDVELRERHASARHKPLLESASPKKR